MGPEASALRSRFCYGSNADTPYVNEARPLQPPEQTSAEVSLNQLDSIRLWLRVYEFAT